MFLFCDRILSEFLLNACLIKHFNIKLYGKVELQFEALKTPALGGNAYARAISFLQEASQFTLKRRICGPRVVLHAVESRKISASFGKRIRILWHCNSYTGWCIDNFGSKKQFYVPEYLNFIIWEVFGQFYLFRRV